MGLAVTVTTAPDWVGDGVEAAGKRSKSSFSVFPGGSFWEQAAFSALTSAPYVSVGRVMIQLIDPCGHTVYHDLGVWHLFQAFYAVVYYF